tara:strand:+ start:2659 stop:3921 length:1263 start_codon:yes stop_codon:yes gene_type:complete
MAIANQGYRRDLNLQETTNDTVALDNLAGAGTADDISYLQNNLRNTSNIPFNAIDSNGFFSFANDRLITASSIVSIGNSDSNGNDINESTIQVGLTNSYLLKFGDLVEISGITESGATDLNGQYSVTAVSPDLETVTFIKSGIHTDVSPSLSGVTFKLKSQNIFVYTDGDVVGVNENVTIGGVSFQENTNYIVVESDGVSKFKLSNDGTTAISITANATANPDNFQFKRQDPVHQEQIINYIKPQIQDTEFFRYPDDINGTFDSTQSNIESAEFFSLKKYRGDQSITTPDSIKFEGSINLHDPDNYNQTGDLVTNKGVTGEPAPGIYIGPTRAFSSDNNPWVESAGTGSVNGKLTTESEEVSIGELAFLDGNNSMVITGIDNDVSAVSGVVASSFTHKVPIQIQDGSGNKETYYLLVTEN